ncbi:MAG: periplasmic heavy metal sensor [Desulfobacteraceae bacterium]|nr:periplasmic heavy metal sensor [Desulfobacteraceae bacterium]
MKKSAIIISTVLLVAFIAGIGFAYGTGRGGGAGYGYGGQNAWSDLSQEQKDSLTALRQKFIDESYEFRSAKLQKKQEIKMLMETSEPDREKLYQLSQEMADLQKQVRDKQIDYKLAAKKIAPGLNMGSRGKHSRGKWQNNRGRGNQYGQGGCQGPGSSGGYNNNTN